MKESPQQTQRDKEFGREQDNGKCPCKADMSRHIFSYRNDHPHGCPAVCHNIHNAHRIELHGQHLHRDLSEPFRLLIHFLRLHLIRLIDLERCKALKILKKAVAQLCVDPPVFAEQFFGKLLHRHDGQRDQRYTDQKHNTGFHTDRR